MRTARRPTDAEHVPGDVHGDEVDNMGGVAFDAWDLPNAGTRRVDPPVPVRVKPGYRNGLIQNPAISPEDMPGSTAWGYDADFDPAYEQTQSWEIGRASTVAARKPPAAWSVRVLAPAMPGMVVVWGGMFQLVYTTTDMAHAGWPALLVAAVYSVISIWLCLYLSIHLQGGDRLLLAAILALAAISLVCNWALEPVVLASRSTREAAALHGFAFKQTVIVVFGLSTLGIVASTMSLSWLRRRSYLAAALAAVGVGLTIAVDSQWLSIPVIGTNIQPSELLKLGLILFVSAYADEQASRIRGRHSGWQIGRLRMPPVPALLPILITLGGALALIKIQGDLGLALLCYGTVVFVLYQAARRTSYLLAGLGLFAGVVWVLTMFLPGMLGTAPERVKIWLDPYHYGNDAGQQIVMSFYSLATGRWFGTGLTYGRPYFIPEVQTDFIASAIGETWGLIGIAVVLALYSILMWRGMGASARVRNGFESLLAGGIAVAITLQVLVIMGGTSGVIPLSGVTLPLISAGGSSFLTTCFALGLLLRISANASQKAVGVTHDHEYAFYEDDKDEEYDEAG